MEAKAFVLLTKIYSGLTEFKKDMNEFRKKANSRFDCIEGDLLLHENEHGKKLDALFDGYKQTYKKMEALED